MPTARAPAAARRRRGPQTGRGRRSAGDYSPGGRGVARDDRTGAGAAEPCGARKLADDRRIADRQVTGDPRHAGEVDAMARPAVARDTGACHEPTVGADPRRRAPAPGSRIHGRRLGGGVACADLEAEILAPCSRSRGDGDPFARFGPRLHYRRKVDPGHSFSRRRPSAPRGPGARGSATSPLRRLREPPRRGAIRNLPAVGVRVPAGMSIDEIPYSAPVLRRPYDGARGLSGRSRHDCESPAHALANSGRI